MYHHVDTFSLPPSTTRPVQSPRAWWAMPRSKGLRGWKGGGAGLGAPAPAAPQDRNGRADELLHNLASGESRDPKGIVRHLASPETP